MKFKKTLLIATTTIGAAAPLIGSFAATSKNVGDTKTTLSNLVNKLEIFNINYEDFTKAGTKSNGLYSPVWFEGKDLGFNAKNPDFNDANTKAAILGWVKKAKWAFVENYHSLGENLEVTLDWRSYEKAGSNIKKVDADGNLVIVITTIDGKKLDIDTTGFEGRISKISDSKIKIKLNLEEVYNAWFNGYLIYYNNWGIFNHDTSFRETTKRFDRTVIQGINGAPILKKYELKDVKNAFKKMMRGGFENYTNWIKYDSTSIPDTIFTAVQKYANAVLRADKTLGWIHYANKFKATDESYIKTPHQNQNRALITLDGGPVPDADRLTMFMNNFSSNFQPAGDIFSLNEGQYGLIPTQMVYNEGTDENNIYLQAFKSDAKYDDYKTKLIAGTLNDGEAIQLMMGTSEFDKEDLFMLVTSMAYSMVDSDRAWALSTYINKLKEKVNVGGKIVEIPRYESIGLGGRSHGMWASMAVIFSGRHQKNLLGADGLIDRIFAEKNTLMPFIANDTGLQSGYTSDWSSRTFAVNVADDFKGNTVDQGVDWKELYVDAFGDASPDLYNNYEVSVNPSINFLNTIDQDSIAAGDQPTYEYVFNDGSKHNLPAHGSKFTYSPYNLANNKINLTKFSVPGTRRKVFEVFGYFDQINAAMASTTNTWLKDFLKNQLYLESSHRDPNIGLVYKEEVDWARGLGLHYNTRDDRPDLTWYNHGENNTSRGNHHDEPNYRDFKGIFGLNA